MMDLNRNHRCQPESTIMTLSDRYQQWHTAASESALPLITMPSTAWGKDTAAVSASDYYQCRNSQILMPMMLQLCNTPL